MHVPSDAFQGRSPEIAARDALGRLFTAVAARATLAETLEREGAESETYLALKAYVDAHPIGRDGNDWLRGLMARDDAGSRAAGCACWRRERRTRTRCFRSRRCGRWWRRR